MDRDFTINPLTNKPLEDESCIPRLKVLYRAYDNWGLGIRGSDPAELYCIRKEMKEIYEADKQKRLYRLEMEEKKWREGHSKWLIAF